MIADTGYGSAAMLGWLVHEEGIEPHIPVFDKSARKDGTFSRSNFTYDHQRDLYVCLAGKELRHYRRQFQRPRVGVDAEGLMRYRASMRDCGPCSPKERCCPGHPARKVLRSVHEGARDTARQKAAKPSANVHHAAPSQKPSGPFSTESVECRQRPGRLV